MFKTLMESQYFERFFPCCVDMDCTINYHKMVISYSRFFFNRDCIHIILSEEYIYFVK